jgi:hypothetical protein
VNPARKRLPPYGRALLAKRRSGLAPDQRGVCITDSWDWGRAFAWRAVVADRENLGNLDFSFVSGLEVIVFAGTRARLDLIAGAVAAFQPHRVVGVLLDPPSIVSFVAPTV